MFEPAFTGSGVSVTLTDRSADGGVATVVVVVAESLPGVGSAVAVATVAESVITVPPGVAASTLTTRVNTSLAAAATLERQQVTEPVAPTAGVVQDQPAAETSDTKVVFAGIASLSVAVAAASGPELPTVIV